MARKRSIKLLCWNDTLIVPVVTPRLAPREGVSTEGGDSRGAEDRRRSLPRGRVLRHGLFQPCELGIVHVETVEVALCLGPLAERLLAGTAQEEAVLRDEVEVLAAQRRRSGVIDSKHLLLETTSS